MKRQVHGFSSILIWVFCLCLISSGNVSLDIKEGHVNPLSLIVKPVNYTLKTTIPVTEVDSTYTTTTPVELKDETPTESTVKEPETKTNTNSNLLHGYTPYQVMMFHLKAHESFSNKPYPDGKYNSIGFGLNLYPANRKFAAKELKDGKISWNEGVELLRRYVEERIYPQVEKNHPNATPFQKVALVCHQYNTGNTRNFGYCCGAGPKYWRKYHKRCANKNKNVRTAHNERRTFEVQLYNGTLTLDDLKNEQKKAAELQSIAKNF